MGTAIRTTRPVSEVWRRLDRVPDPELDEPVTDLGFVEGVRVTGGGRVEVEFRLPTYWCSPNFAFLMCEGIRAEVGALDWVETVVVHLRDHMYGEEVSAGVNAGRSFPEIFPELSQGEDLEALREKFAEKAFHRRQESVLLGLRALDLGAAEIVGMTLGELDATALSDPAAEAQKPRYREILLERGLAAGPQDPAFPTFEGEAIAPGDLAAHLARLRGIRINMEFSGALCRGLKGTRYKEVVREGDEPTLVDFILGRVPPREEAGTADAR